MLSIIEIAICHFVCLVTNPCFLCSVEEGAFCSQAFTFFFFGFFWFDRYPDSEDEYRIRAREELNRGGERMNGKLLALRKGKGRICSNGEKRLKKGVRYLTLVLVHVHTSGRQHSEVSCPK